ncbi:SDR family NAD(P)-dependent oxidoreductase [Lentzea sp. NPDC058450]|uniref:SDR family NAD(P)-dependent oxidoreductase n=1 Tax=Lentzea sp. NPDC058450 TaxID=3346505 RepID=UPI00364AF3B7
MSRVVVVSGGGTGIGRAVAHRFADAGDRVVVVGRRVDVLERTAAEINASTGSGLVSSLTADLAEPREAVRVAETVVARHGQVDVLVNNAGGNVEIGAPDGATTGVEGAAWHWLGNFRSNVLTAVLLTEALKDALPAGARVVLVSSIAAYRGSGSGSYAGSKAALHPYAYDLAAQLGPKGVTVNVVAPGYVAETEFFANRLSPERERMLVGQTSTGRASTPADVANSVFWLASPEADQVTAQIVQVNGGALAGR